MCDNLAKPISRLIEDAVLLCGGQRTGVTIGGVVDLSVDLLNNILAMWSTNAHYIPYETEFIFESIPDRVFYEIGQGRIIESMPFLNITGVWYRVSETWVPVTFQTYRSFNHNTFQGATGYPAIYTYEPQKGYTQFGLLPRGYQIPIKIYGKQALGNVLLFDVAISKIPDYMIQPLTYKLADQLIARGFGVPADNFYTNLSQLEGVMKAAAKVDNQSDIRPTLMNDGAAVPLGLYYGGAVGGYRGY